MTRSYDKRGDQTKTFLKEARTLIELINLVDRFRSRDKKLNKCRYECKGKKYESRKHRLGVTRGHRDCSGHARSQALHKSLKVTVQYKSKNNRSGRTSSKIIRCTSKSGQISSSDKQSKSHRHRNKRHSSDTTKKNISSIHVKMNNNFDDVKAKIYTSKLNENTRAADREIERHILYDLDRINYVRIYSLNDILNLGDKDSLDKTPLLLSKADDPGSVHMPNFLLLNNESLNGNNKKRVNEESYSTKYIKKEIKSLNFTLNMRIKADSNNINLKVKTKKASSSSCRSFKYEPNDFCVYNQCYSTSPQEHMNRVLMNMLTRKLSNSSIGELSCNLLVKKIDEEEFMKKQKQIMNPNFRDMTNAKTQAVYNVYDISNPQFPTPRGGELRVLKSNVHFDLNIGKGPKTEQTIRTSPPYTPYGTSEGKEIRYKSKVGYNSGTTSLQQSFSVGRKPQPEEYYVSEPSLPCDCEPFECDPSIDSEQTGTSTCPTCCQYEEPVYVPPEKFNYITTLKRAKKRIMDRVANVRDDASEIVTSPGTFFKNLYDKRVNKFKIEPAQKDVGSCTCKPFIDTEHVSVIEKNYRPDCSFWQRLFGDLFFSDKCVVCNKETETRKKDKFACGPGICLEPSGISACISKWFDKCKKKMPKKKKKKKEKDSLICKLICKMFCGQTDEERQKLLKKKAKIKKLKARAAEKKQGKPGEGPARSNAKTKYPGRRQFRKATKRIRDKYYRNKKMAEQQKGRYACDFYLMSLRNKPCLWVYYMCPFCYPHCLQLLSIWRQISDIMLFFVAIVVWSPCILFAECLKVCACNMFV